MTVLVGFMDQHFFILERGHPSAVQLGGLDFHMISSVSPVHYANVRLGSLWHRL